MGRSITHKQLPKIAVLRLSCSYVRFYERLPNEFQTVPKLLLRVTYESQVRSSSFTKRAGRVNSDPEVGFAPATRLASLPSRLDPKDSFSGCEQVTDDGTTSVQPWPNHGRTTSVCDVVVMSSFPSDLRQPPNRIVQSNEWEVRQHFHLRRNPTTAKQGLIEYFPNLTIFPLAGKYVFVVTAMQTNRSVILCL